MNIGYVYGRTEVIAGFDTNLEFIAPGSPRFLRRHHGDGKLWFPIFLHLKVADNFFLRSLAVFVLVGYDHLVISQNRALR